MSHFCGSREAPQVNLQLSLLIYEVGGNFDQHLNYQRTSTDQLNALLMLHPAFGRVLGASSPAKGGACTSSGAGASGAGSPGGGVAKESKSHYANGKLYFGKGTSGPTYIQALIMAELRKVKPINQNNFCLEFFLSTQGYCSQVKHHAKCAQHKWPAALAELRDTFEHKPYRVDAKALPEKK
jgi:hypothetical protein